MRGGHCGREIVVACKMSQPGCVKYARIQPNKKLRTFIVKVHRSLTDKAHQLNVLGVC